MSTYSHILEKLIAGTHLSEDEAYALMKEILGGSLLPTAIAAVLVALRIKQETPDEISGFVKAMRDSMTKVPSVHPNLVDTCGTGGDGKGTFNISTASALLVSAAGYPVAKHGNRSISSRCGSSDVLEALGVKYDMARELAEKNLNDLGITFFFAPLYHPAMKNVGPVRKDLGVRTVFNILGPLANPAGANIQVIGVPNKDLVKKMAQVLVRLNRGRKSAALVVHEAGYDECVLLGQCITAEVYGDKIKYKTITPKDFGYKKVSIKDLKGDDATANARLTREIFSGKNIPLKHVVCANAALAIALAEKVKTHKPFSLKDAAKKAEAALTSGAALKKLDDFAPGSQNS